MKLERKTLGAVALGLALVSAVPATAAGADPAVACSDGSAESLRLDMQVHAQDTDRLEDAFGFYALPSGAPKAIVVFAHGHSNSAYKWKPIVAEQAERLGAITVAMDYRRQTFPGGDITRSSFGWRVREGAEDSIAAAQLFERRCRGSAGRLPIVMYGVSMGGNTSGLAVASEAKRSDGSPLFDWWFNIEGVTNVIETYYEARAVAGPPINNETGQIAVAEIEEEMGGSFEEKPDVYLQHTVVARAQDIKASGIKGVVMVHGADDGTVGYNQSPEMFGRLVEQQIPTDFFTVGLHGDSPDGQTLEDTFLSPTPIRGYTSPFTGHGGENDMDHPVIRTGFDRLAALLNDGRTPSCYRKFVVNDSTSTPDPDAIPDVSCSTSSQDDPGESGPGPGGGPGGGGGGSAQAAPGNDSSSPPSDVRAPAAAAARFGRKTGVTLALGKARTRGPLVVRVSNRNPFPLVATLRADIAPARGATAARRRARPIRLGSKRLSVGASAIATVKFRLPRAARARLRGARRLSIRLSARVNDPAGASRAVRRTLARGLPKPKRR